MYKLKDISTYSLIIRGKNNKRLWAYALINYKVRDYEALKEMIESGKPIFQDQFLKDELDRVTSALIKINNEKQKDTIFSFPTYDNSQFDGDILRKFEKLISGSELLVASPTNLQRTTFDRLKGLTIAEIKNLLMHIDENGINTFRANLSSFGTYKTRKVYEAVRFLESQMLRIAESTPNYGQYLNLFTKDAELKRNMILDDKEQVLAEFLSGSEEYIFGKLIDKAKNRILEAFISPQNKVDYEIQKRIIDIIANYTISSELEKGETRVRAMERFH